MTDPALLLSGTALVPISPLHGAAPSTPVPHWAVLLVAVPLLWFVTGAIVMAIDRLLRRFDA